jgi:hypothetical protein
LAWTTRYRVTTPGQGARVEDFTFERTALGDGDIDSVKGRLVYPGLSATHVLSVRWSDGTTSEGTIVFKDGEYWFFAEHSYNAKATANLINLSVLDPTSSKRIGSFDIAPRASVGLPTKSDQPLQNSAPGEKHGNAAPLGKSSYADLRLEPASHAAFGVSDVGLVVGMGVLGAGYAGARKPASHRKSGASAGGVTPRRSEGRNFWLDRSLAKTIELYSGGERTRGPSAVVPQIKPFDDDWMVARYGDDLADESGAEGSAHQHQSSGLDGFDDWLLVPRQGITETPTPRAQ